VYAEEGDPQVLNHKFLWNGFCRLS